jgi:hypothetical protein
MNKLNKNARALLILGNSIMFICVCLWKSQTVSPLARLMVAGIFIGLIAAFSFTWQCRKSVKNENQVQNPQ